MRCFLVGVCVVATFGAWFTASSSARLRADCTYLTDEGKAINQADLAFTKQAYSDGTITPDEEDQADVYGAQTAAITKALEACIGGVPAPVASGLVLSGETWKTSGGDSLVIRWSTDQPAKAEILFQHTVKGKQLIAGAITVATGKKSVTFSGKAGSVEIKPGRYLLTLVTTNAKGAQSKPLTKRLTVLP